METARTRGKAVQSNTFAKRLREIRRSRGYRSAKKLALALGINPSTYSHYERGKTEPEFDVIYAICSQLDVTPNDLFGFTTSSIRAALPLALTPPGLAETSAQFGTPQSGKPALSDMTSSPARRLELQTYQLACDLSGVAGETGRKAKRKSAAPVDMLRRRTEIFDDLKRDPLGTINAIVRSDGMEAAPPNIQAQLSEKIEAYIAELSRIVEQSAA